MPTQKPLGTPPPNVYIPEKETAIAKAIQCGDRLVAFTDRSIRNNLAGIGVYWTGSSQAWGPASKTISTPDHINAHIGELAAIDAATTQLLNYAKSEPGELHPVLFSDSQEALKSLKSPGQQSGQALITSIIRNAQDINQLTKASVQFQWSPGHSNIPGNETAHRLAKEATRKGKSVDPLADRSTLLSVALRAAKEKMGTPSKISFYSDKTGRFTKSFDKALPGAHTSLLYNGRSKLQAKILCQLRSGINRLNKYLARINAVESEECTCRKGTESVDHFLFRCPRWGSFRGEIRRLAGRRWGDTSYLLGGWSGEIKDGPLKDWKPTTEMVTATINFAIATKRLEDRREKGDSEEEDDERDGE